ncbi:MAG: hypothetical protein ACR2MN_00980 [Acidimicrobiales bacterium]
MLEPDAFIPSLARCATATTVVADPYEAAWRVTHCGKSLSEAIDDLIATLCIPYDLASSLVWAEMSSPSVRVPD